jgi:hypothetical protein
LAPHLPKTQQLQTYIECLDVIRAIEDKDRRAELLTLLAPILPLEHQNEVYIDALITSRSMSIARRCARVITALAPHLSAELLTEALSVAQSIIDDTSKVQSLAALLPYLPTQQQEEVLTNALSVAQTIEDTDNRTSTLIILATYLTSDQQTKIYADALTTIGELASNSPSSGSQEPTFAQTLKILVPRLPPVLFPSALAVALSIEDEDDRIWSLDELAIHLAICTKTSPFSNWGEVWQQTIKVSTSTAWDRPALLRALTALTPWLEALATPDDLADIAQSIIDVARCWP